MPVLHPNAVAALRAAILSLREREESARAERKDLQRRLAETLSPVKAGERFTAEGQVWGATKQLTVSRETVFVCAGIEPFGAGLRDVTRLSYLVVARRLLADGSGSKLTYCFSKTNKPRRIV
jgi:hypothetical protein